MHPEDRVLVGVVKRKVDVEIAREQCWYRIPVEHAPRSIESEYVGLFLNQTSSRQMGKPTSGIYYYARCTGHELVRRRDLLPEESTHSRADHWYYKLSLAPLQEKSPPILNPKHRSFAFIFTTWDRFFTAQEVADLYSTSEFYVERISRVLTKQGIAVSPDQLWQDDDIRRKINGLRQRLEAMLTAKQDSEEASSTHEDEALQATIEALAGIPFLDIPFDG